MMNFNFPEAHPWDGWDTASLLVTISALFDYVPKLAAVLALLVWGLRLWRDPVIQDLVTKWRNRGKK